MAVRTLACTFVALAFGIASALPAQLAIYGMGSGGRLSGVNVGAGTGAGAQGSVTAWGGTVGLYDNFLRLGPVKLGTDVRGFLQSSSGNNPNGNQVRGLLVGPRLALKLPMVPFKPYLQGELGAASTNYGVNASRTGNFAYQISGGLDVTIFPHLDAHAEYGAGQLDSVFGSSSHQTLQEFGLGLVLRLF